MSLLTNPTRWRYYIPGDLQRNRLGNTTDEDIKILGQQVIGPMGPPEQAVKLASRRVMVADINKQESSQLFTRQRGNPILYIDLRVDDLTKNETRAERANSRRMVVTPIQANFDDLKQSVEVFQLGDTLRRMALTFIPIRGQRVILITKEVAHDHQCSLGQGYWRHLLFLFDFLTF